MVSKAIFLCLLIILLHCWESNAANILVAIPFTSTSHYVLLRPIGLELAKRGHNVTVLTSHTEKEHPEHYHEIKADDIKIWESVAGGRPNVFTMVDYSFEKFYHIILFNGGLATTENVLKSNSVKEFMSQNNTFDLVISELFFQEALYMFSHVYNAPLVLMNTFGNCVRNNFVMRNPMQFSTLLEEFGTVRNPTSFTGRLTNLYYSMYEYLWWKLVYMPQQEEFVTKYFRNLTETRPSLIELQEKASLALYNGHFSMDTPAAYLPNIIEVGGLHLSKSDKNLPSDIQKILDNAKHGVVYVNFGSNVRSAELPPEKRDAFLNVFRKLKQTVLWKWEDTTLENKPANVEIRDWMPQKEILAHPNIRVFIAHGGLIGLQEATFHGVPIIGVPIYADQYNNLLQAEKHGYGVVLEYHTINEETLEKTLHRVLQDDSFKSKAKEISIRFKDRPMNGLDTSIYWIEYVLRHKGASFMRNPAIEYSFWEYHMLDVYGFLVFVVVAIIFVVFKLLKVFLRKIFLEEEKQKKH